jgi:hypothetical protein
MKQRLHANLAPIDILTREEMEEITQKNFSAQTRERFRGIDAARLPPIAVTATSTATLNLFAGGASDGDAGPEQGDVWLLRRANVLSSAFSTDSARYALFRGSTPSDPINGYTNRQLLTIVGNNGGFSTTVVTPAFPGSASNIQNPYPFPVQVVITGGTATQTQVNGQIVGGGDGTYVVPVGGSIQVTYSVQPTWVWSNLNGAYQAGQTVGLEYDAPNKGCLFQPGEQLYAQVFAPTVGNTYLLTGEFIRCPAEMKGKLLG